MHIRSRTLWYVVDKNVNDIIYLRFRLTGIQSTGARTAVTAAAISRHQLTTTTNSRLENLRQTLGEDAFSGLEALVDCKHEIALGYGRTAAQSSNHNYALAGLWIQVLAYADSRQEAKARAVFPELVAEDDKLTTEIQAETEMREALKKLMDIRQENGRPAVCG